MPFTMPEADPKCAGCWRTVTAAVMGDGLDIPDFLRRSLHPEYGSKPPVHTTAPRIQVTQRGDYGINRHREYETDHDRELRAKLLAEEQGKTTAQKAETRKQKEAEKEELASKIREGFVQTRKELFGNFKWDWEK